MPAPRTMPWDELPVPATGDELKAALHGPAMFFTTVGPPQAYFEIADDIGPQGQGYVHRVIYRVVGYSKTLGAQTRQAAEAELVACVWQDMLGIRRWMHGHLGDNQPLLFWRRWPEFICEPTEEGSSDWRAQFTLRIGVPGYDWKECFGVRKEGERAVESCTEERKAIIRQADLCAVLSQKANEATQAHLNAFHKLLAMRTPSSEPVYGAGVLSLPHVQHANARRHAEMRDLLTSPLNDGKPR